jgi:hypothetical protein
MPDISRLVIEVDSKGVLKATGDLEVFSKIGGKAGKSADDLADKMGALQLITGKLPGPLKSVASGLMGIVSPATAAISVILELGEAFIKSSKESEEAYIEQQVNFARLDAVFEATNAKAWTSAQELQNYASTLRKTTGRTANEIMQMQSVLLGFTGITGENFERLTKNMIDMADVMGGSLVSAANTFGRALENPSESLSALTRQGFVFTEEQKRMVRQLENAGKIQEAQVIYLEAMEKAFGESASATREAAKEINDYKQALEDLKLARGEFEASGGMTWQRFWREFMQPGIEDNARRYREATEKRNKDLMYEDINRRADEAATNYLQTIKTAEELIAIIESGKVDINDLYRAVLMKFGDGSKDMSERLLWQDALIPLRDYKEEYDRITEEIRREAGRIQGNKNNMSAVIAKIEIDYDDTSESKIEKLIAKIAELRKLCESSWETNTGIFEGLSDEYKGKIDVIIKELEESLENAQGKAKKVKHEFADWVEVLAQATDYTREQVELWQGLETVQKYAADGIEAVRDRFLKEIPSGGLLYEMLGLNKTEIYESAAQKMRSLVQIMTEARIKDPWDIEKDRSYQEAISILQGYEELAREASYDDAIKELELRREIIGIAREELRIKELTAKFGNEERARTYYDMEQNIEADENYTQDKELLNYKLQVIWLSEERFRIEELTDKYLSDARAREIFALEQQIEKTLALKSALQSLAQAGLQITATGLVTFAHDLGSAFRDGTISSDELSGAIGNIVRSMIDALPQLLLNVGLQLIMAKQWALGLAFIGASGLMSFVSGMIEDSEDSSRDDEAERLRRIQDQITDLINQQRKQEEYYATKKRSVNASSISVNDAIITPKGTVYTDPEDYIIATKKPESLMSNGGVGNVFINVENNAPVKINTESEIADDGTKTIKMTIEQIVQSGIANGTFDGAFNAMNNRRNGRRVQN